MPKNQGSRKRKGFSSLLQLLLREPWSASLCCDWIIILLLIRVVYVFSVDSFQRGRGLCAIQQDEISPMKASQRSPREQAGGRASRQIQGDATATGYASQSHMAPGQTGRKAITYSLMSLLPSFLPPPPLFPKKDSSIRKETEMRVRVSRRWTGINCVDISFAAVYMNLLLQQHLPHLHTHEHTPEHTPTHLSFITLLLLCPELTVHAQQDHSSYTQPPGSLAVPLSHTLTSSLLAALLFSLPLFLYLSLSHTYTHSLPLSLSLTHTYKHTVISLPPLLTVLTEREASISRVISL